MADDEGKAGAVPALQVSGITSTTEEKDQKRNEATLDERTKAFETDALALGSHAYVIKRIEALKATNTPAVLFIGVSETGKTWLLQRMKQILGKTYDCKPRLAITKAEKSTEQVAQQDADYANKKGMESSPLSEREKLALQEKLEGSQTERSNLIIFHEFTRIGTPGFALIDVPGERITRLADGRFSELRALMAIFDYANAVIIALPADTVLLGPHIHDLATDFGEEGAKFAEDVELMSDFTDGISSMAAARSLWRHSGKGQIPWKAPGEVGEDEFDRLIHFQSVHDHMRDIDGFSPIGGDDGMSCPAFFALTKSDRLLSALGQLPDAATTSDGYQKKFSEAHATLNATPHGQIMHALADAAKKSLADRFPRRWWERIFGRSPAPEAPISKPPELVRIFNDKLFDRLNTYFPMGRFDLVSAFYGNTKNRLSSDDMQKMPTVGVSELIGWLRDVDTHGVNDCHAWARSVFCRLYPEDDQGAPVGNTGNRELGVAGSRKGKFLSRRRVLWSPEFALRPMFAKSWHPLRWLPGAVSLVMLAVLVWGATYFIESTSRYSDGQTYAEFAQALDPQVAADHPATAPERIDALTDLPRPQNATETAALDSWNPLTGLKGWNENRETGAVFVPASFEAPGSANPDESTEFRARQVAWQQDKVCGLEGWGDYRPIVRLAALNGYGQCSSIDKIAMRIRLVDMWGWPLGGLALVVLASLLGLAIWYWRWAHTTRKAYAWLYHSRSATTAKQRVE